MRTLNTRECSTYSFSSEIRDKVIKNLPENETVIFCFEAYAKYNWRSQDNIWAGTYVKKQSVNYYAGVITKHWLLSMRYYHNERGPEYDNGEGDVEEYVSLMPLSAVQDIKRGYSSADINDGDDDTEFPQIVVTGSRYPSCYFHFDTQRLMYKFEDVLKNAVNTKKNAKAQNSLLVFWETAQSLTTSGRN